MLERSTGKHRSLPSATGQFVLMIFSKVCFFFVFFCVPEVFVHVFICFTLLMYYTEKTMEEYFHYRTHLSASSFIQMSSERLQ